MCIVAQGSQGTQSPVLFFAADMQTRWHLYVVNPHFLHLFPYSPIISTCAFLRCFLFLFCYCNQHFFACLTNKSYNLCLFIPPGQQFMLVYPSKPTICTFFKGQTGIFSLFIPSVQQFLLVYHFSPTISPCLSLRSKNFFLFITSIKKFLLVYHFNQKISSCLFLQLKNFFLFIT